MSRIVEKLHIERLKNCGINIKTKYRTENLILEKNSDNSKNDNIGEGVIIEKDYYKNGFLIKKIYNFDPRIQYSFISSEDENKEICCPNCGNRALGKNFIDGCPYCGTYYNIDYKNKNLGNKYHYDMIVNSNNYILITLFVDIIVCLILFFLYIKFSSRTFNIYDISKATVGGLLTGFALFYVFYMIDAFIVMLPIKMYKNKINQKQIDFWNKMQDKGIDKTKFYNNFNYELQKYYYNNSIENENVIDYDIIDYNNFEEFNNRKQNMCIKLEVSIRVIRFINNKIVSKNEKKVFVLEKNSKPIKDLNNGINIIECRNCGASIDVTKGECNYCKTEYNFFQEWYLYNNSDK